MSVNSGPKSLVDLALESIKEAMYNAGKDLLISGDEDCISRGSKIFLREIEGLNKFALPCVIIDGAVTQQLAAIYQLMTGTSMPFYHYQPLIPRKPWDVDVFQRLISVAINSDLTTLDISKAPLVLREMLYRCLRTLHSLRILKITTADIDYVSAEEYAHSENGMVDHLIEGLTVMNLLQSLDLQYSCTDELLSLLKVNCNGLKYLDIRNSRGVTALGVNSILGLPLLEQLMLNGTAIDQTGVSSLVQKIPLHFIENGDRVNSIGLDGLKNQQIGLLQQSCRNISTVLFGRCFFSEIRTFLRSKGGNILELGLSSVRKVNLGIIGQLCPSLRKLTVSDCGFQNPSPNVVVTFENIEEFKAKVMDVRDIEIILKRCKSLRTLSMCCLFGTLNSVSRVVGPNPMGQLRSLKLETIDGRETAFIARLILAKNPRMEYLSILGAWGSMPDEEIEAFREEFVGSNPGIEVNFDGL